MVTSSKANKLGKIAYVRLAIKGYKNKADNEDPKSALNN